MPVPTTTAVSLNDYILPTPMLSNLSLLNTKMSSLNWKLNYRKKTYKDIIQLTQEKNHQPGSAKGGELKIEDCILNSCGWRSRSAGACAACRSVLFKFVRIP
jgi:hypothetical protein